MTDVEDTPANTPILAEWTLDMCILQITIECGGDKEAESLEIPIGISTIGVKGATHISDLKLLPVWRKIANEDCLAIDPHTNEKRKIVKGTIMTYPDTPAIVDCEKPDELVAEDANA